MQHQPVLLKEVIEFLKVLPNHNYVDGTLGAGGYSQEILAHSVPNGRVLAIDCDEETIIATGKELEKFTDRFTAVHGNFADIARIIHDNSFLPVSGIVLDLGVSSMQLDDPRYGLSFMRDANLDMRLDDREKNTAAYVLNNYSEKRLADVFYYLGDVRGSKALANKIAVSRRKKRLQTNNDLINIIGSRNPKFLAPIFQALRIEVNGEFNNLEKFLVSSIKILNSHARLVVVSYHSGEDRIVKNAFRDNKNCLNILTSKPITPSMEEIRANSRSRSAKLRAVEKI